MIPRFLSIAQIRHIESDAQSKYKLDLMDIAGARIAQWVNKNFIKSQKILILVGRGNNGGDGVVAALKLKELGFNVNLLTTASQLNPITEGLITKFKHAGGKQLIRLPVRLSNYALIIDAILGIGINGILDDKLIELIELINRSECFVLSVDTPTGLDPFSGEIYGTAIRANHTITFISDKPGFYTGNGIDLVGHITVEPLVDLDNFTLAQLHTINIVPNEIVLLNYAVLKRKLRNTNKGSFGTVAIVGGNKGMHGALYLAGRAAMLLGSGKVILASLDQEEFATDLFMPELMLAKPKDILKNIDNYSTVIIGPGLGQDAKALAFLTKLFKQKLHGKFIFDADALNLVAQHPELQPGFKLISQKIITPHPGEASRLLGVTVNEVERNRFAAVRNLSNQYCAITLLKGAGSLIQDDRCVYLNLTGNAVLSSSGQGDILCGIIAALIAQGMSCSDALRFAVNLHGKSAEYLANTIGYTGVLASEIIYAARQLLNKLLYA